MADAESNKRRILLEAGSLVILHPDGPAGGFPLVVSVDQVADGLHWFLGSCDPIGRGETVIVESPVIDDSRYLTGNTLFVDGGSHINGVSWDPGLPEDPPTA